MGGGDDDLGGESESAVSKAASKAATPQKENPYQNGKRVYDCLAKSLKRASDVQDKEEQIPLYIEALNRYTYFFKAGVPTITAVVREKIIPLKMLIKEELDNSIGIFFLSYLSK